MASSGVTLEDDVVQRFNNDFKMMKNRKFIYQTFSFTDDKKKICVSDEGTSDQELSNSLSKCSRAGKSCYFVYLDEKVADSNAKIYLVLFCDDDTVGAREKMLAASSFTALKKQLIGYQTEKELHSLDEAMELFKLPPPSE